MALINCPECGKEISDKAIKCPNCGKELNEQDVKIKFCEECGKELKDTDKICPQCGCPVFEKKEENETKSNIGISRKTIFTIGIGFLSLIIILFAVKGCQKKSSTKKYADNLALASSTMLEGAAKAEKAGGLIHDVWYNTIYEEEDIETDKYTQTSYGSFNDDFNTSLQNLFSDSSFKLSITIIEMNQEEVKSIMKELKNPPEEFKEAYDVLREYYDAYLELTELVINPTGSLQTFTSDFNDADTSVAKCYETMNMYIEE